MLDCVELSTTAQPDAAVIWLHGLGADGYDFVPMVKELEALQVPAARYVFPHAPMRAVTINGGFVMRAWYDIYEMDFVRREDEAGVRQSQAQLEALIEREVDRGVPSERIVLAGFSQGGAIVLHTGLRQTQTLAGIVALSTYLPLAHRLEAERATANAQVPIFMAHGTADPVVPMARGTTTREQLSALAYDVQWHEYPMQHSVCAQEVGDLADFLRQVLSESD